MKHIFNTIFKNRILVIFTTILCIIAGLFAYNAIPKQSFPTTELPILQVNITAPGYSAKDLNNDVVPEIEDKIRDLEHINDVQSISFSNGASIISIFKIDEVIDIHDQYIKLRDDINNLKFDTGISISYEYNFVESHVIFAITGDKKSETASELKKLLSDLDEVKRVDIRPNYSDSIVIDIDVSKLQQFKISYADIINLLNANGLEIPLGYLEEDNSSVPISSDNNFKTIEEIENIPISISPSTGQPVLLKNISNISSKSTTNSQYEFNKEIAVLVNLYFVDGDDYSKLGKKIENVVNEHDDSDNIHKVVFQPDEVKYEINKIFTSLLQSLGLVFIIVLIGLGFRSSLIVTISFPFTIFTTLLILYILGYDLQKISIAGLIISIGIIVDNTIVVIDAIKYNINNGLKVKPAINLALKDNFKPVLSSTLTTIAAFTPLMFLPGIAGEIAFSLPLTVIIALILSLIVSVIIIPCVSYYFIGDNNTVKKKPKDRSYKLLTKFLTKIYKHAVFTVILSFLVAIALTSFVFRLKIKVFPTAEQNIVYVIYTNTSSTRYDDTQELEDEMIHFISETSYYKNYSSGITSIINGHMPQFYSTLPTLPLNQNQGFIFINIKDKSKVSDFKSKLEQDINSKFSSNAIVSVHEVELNRPTAPIFFGVRGENQQEVIDYTDSLLSQLNTIDGVKYAFANIPSQVKNYQIQYNNGYLMQNGLQKIQIEQQIALYLNQSKLNIIESELYADEAVIQTNIKVKDQLLKSSFIINDNLFYGKDLFKLSEQKTFEFYSRDNFTQGIDVSVEIEDDATLFNVNRDVRKIIDKTIPDNIEINYKGETELTKNVFQNIGIAALVALFLIILILLIQFKKLANIFVISIALPLSISGSVLMLFLFNFPISFSGGLGVTTLLGIVVNNGILLVSYLEKYKSEYSSLLEACVEAVKRRLKPILLSNITTMFGLIPLIVSTNSFFQPLSIAMFGGLITGVIFTLLLTPSIYYLFNKRKWFK